MSNVMFTLLSHRYPGHSSLIRSCGKNIGVIYRGQGRDSTQYWRSTSNAGWCRHWFKAAVSPRNGKHAVLARHAAQRSVRTVTSNTGPDTACSLLDTLRKMESWAHLYSYNVFITISNGFVKVCAQALSTHRRQQQTPGVWPQFPHLTGLAQPPVSCLAAATRRRTR